MVDKHEGMPKILDNGVASASAQMSAFLQFSIQVTTACTYSMAYSVPASDSESNSFRVPWEASHVPLGGHPCHTEDPAGPLLCG